MADNSTKKEHFPLGFPVPGWQPRQAPGNVELKGRCSTLRRASTETPTKQLYEAFASDTSNSNWIYLPYGPFDSHAAFKQWFNDTCLGQDPLFYVVYDNDTGQACGIASYLRIQPLVGVVEVGHIHFSPMLQRRTSATEAMYLMMEHAFDTLGYRRYEWKCDALNARSKAAATRLGFTFEGVFRQATMYKGRNRDTAWFSLLDKEWPKIKTKFKSWLAEENFDSHGNQLRSLSSIMRKAS